jgi:hypothetical protein
MEREKEHKRVYWAIDCLSVLKSDDSEGCEGCEVSTEARRHSKQNTNVRNNNNIKNKYKNRIIMLQILTMSYLMDYEKTISSQKLSQPSSSSDFFLLVFCSSSLASSLYPSSLFILFIIEE